MNFRRSIQIAACIVLTAAAGAAHATEASDILGVYWNPDRTRQVEITETDGIFSGRIVWEASASDRQPATMIGHTIIRGFSFDGTEEWVGGEVLAPVGNDVYQGKLWLDDGDLMMRGFVGISLFGRTARLERVSGDEPPR